MPSKAMRLINGIMNKKAMACICDRRPRLLQRGKKTGTAVDQELSGGFAGGEGEATKLTMTWYSHAPAALAYTHV